MADSFVCCTWLWLSLTHEFYNLRVGPYILRKNSLKKE